MKKRQDIVFKDSISLKGPSIWTYPPCIETWIDIGELEDFPSDKIPGLYERLEAWLPGLVEHFEKNTAAIVITVAVIQVCRAH